MKPGTLSLRNVGSDALILRADPKFAGALFQAASQFSLLGMVGWWDGGMVNVVQGILRKAGGCRCQPLGRTLAQICQ